MIAGTLYAVTCIYPEILIQAKNLNSTAGSQGN